MIESELNSSVPFECELRPSSQTPNSNVWTVGDIYTLSCSGLESFEIEEPLRFVFKDPVLEYSLQPLKIDKASPQSFELLVTSYKPGDHSVEGFSLIGANKQEVRLGPLNWKVQSVLNPEVQAQPIAPYGLIKMVYSPWFIWSSVAAVAVLAFVLFRAWFVRHRLKQEVVQKVGSLAQGDPLADWAREMRSLRRRLYLPNSFKEKISTQVFLKGLKQQSELFLVRTLRLPFHSRSPKNLRPWLKRRFPVVEKEHYQSINALFNEIAQALQLEAPSEKDCDQLYVNGLKLTNHLSALLTASNPSNRGRK